MLGSEQRKRIFFTHTEKLKTMLQFVMLLSIAVLTGCSGAEVKTFPQDQEIRLLESGYEFFCREDYENAARRFETICQGTGTGQIRREALYSLACTRMILAENMQDFLDALDLWTVWSRQGTFCPKTLPGENPGMFGPFLEKLATGTGFSCSPETPEPDDAPELYWDIPSESSGDSLEDKVLPEYSQTVKTRSEKKIPASPSASEKKMREQIRKKDREILNLKEQIRKIKKEMEILRTQLDSLEEIHHEIQEKKKDMVPQ